MRLLPTGQWCEFFRSQLELARYLYGPYRAVTGAFGTPLSIQSRNNFRTARKSGENLPPWSEIISRPMRSAGSILLNQLRLPFSVLRVDAMVSTCLIFASARLLRTECRSY